MSTTTVNVKINALLESLGSAVSGGNVSFGYKLLSASTYTSAGSATTSSSGIASVTVPMLLGETYDIQGIFAGTTLFQASMQTITFEPSNTLSQTTIKATVTETGNTANVSGSLTSPAGGVAAGVISLSLDGMALPETFTTALDGSFSGTISNIPAGGHTLVLSYPGSAAYLPSSATVNFRIGPAPQGAVGFGLGLIALVQNVLKNRPILKRIRGQ